MLFFKKNINLILFIVLLILSVFVIIFSEELSKIESLENKDEENKHHENKLNCKSSTKILQSTNTNNQVKTHNIVQNSTHKSKLQRCLFPISHEEQIKQLKMKEKKN